MLNNSFYEFDGSKIVKYIGDEKIVTIPTNVIEIGENAFYGNKNIISVIIPDTVKLIGRSAFASCDNLTTITLGRGLNQIQSGAFGYCNANISLVIYTGTLEDWCNIDIHTPISQKHSLIIDNQLITNIAIPESITTIRENCFYGCTVLSKVHIHRNIDNIENRAFAFCPNLDSFNIDANNKNFNFINGCLIDINYGSIIWGNSKSAIPNDKNINNIADFAFEGCTFLEQISIPSNISSIGVAAFEYCENLIKINLPTKLQAIEPSTFGNCEKLQSIELPIGLTKIDSYAFSCCKNLKSIALPEGLKELGEGVFASCYNLTNLIFPKSLVNIETNFDNPFSDTEIENVYYRGDKEDWENIEVFDCLKNEDLMIKDILSCDIYFNYVDEIETYDDEHNGHLIYTTLPFVVYDCETEECTIEFGEFSNRTNQDVRIWIKDIGIRTFDGNEEVLFEYKSICKLEADDYVIDDFSITIKNTDFQRLYLTPCDIENNPYDYELCCSELFFTLVADLGEHDIEFSDWVFDATEIQLDGKYDEEHDDDEEPDDGNMVCTTSNILYIYKGNIRCHKYNHSMIQTTAILHSRTDSEIKINVEYCTECKKYLLEYTLFEEYRNRYGILIGNFRMAVNGNFDGEYDLALESPLKLSGYNVGQKDGYSSKERHYILAKIIHDNIMEKGEVIRYLSYFIRMNGAKYGNELAVSKWREDLAFVESYNITTQPRAVIYDIRKY